MIRNLICLGALLGMSFYVVAQDEDIIEEEGYSVLRGELRMENGSPVFQSYNCATPGVFSVVAEGDKKAGKILKKINKRLGVADGPMEAVTMKGKLYLGEQKIVPKNWSVQLARPECIDEAPIHCDYFNKIYELYIRNIEITRKMAFFSVISVEEFDEELGENVSVVRCYDVDCVEIDCQQGKAEAGEMWNSIDIELTEIEELRKDIEENLKPKLEAEKGEVSGIGQVALTVQSVQATRMQAKNIAEIPKMLKAKKEAKEAMKLVRD